MVVPRSCEPLGARSASTGANRPSFRASRRFVCSARARPRHDVIVLGTPNARSGKVVRRVLAVVADYDDA
jgi:hypothetical protein